MNGLLNTRFQLSPLGKRSYAGEILRSYITDGLRLADIRFSPHSTCLMPGKLPRSSNSFLVSWQVEGNSLVRQFGRETEVRSGELFFVDTSQPFEIETDDIWTRSVYLDSQFWQEVFPERAQYSAVAMSGNSHMGRICTQLIEQLFVSCHSHPVGTVKRMAGSFANLLAVTMVAEVSPGAAEPATRSMLIDRIRRFARANLANPDLSCEDIAAHVNLSVGHVHQLFSGREQTLMRWVWAERLRLIARDLTNPGLQHKPVSAIAFDWGFSDAAHFSRSFKSQYGMSPTGFRNASQCSLDHMLALPLN